MNTVNTLRPVQGWDKSANGIWKTEIGNIEGELRYTDLAAEPPVIERIERLSDTAFPFEADAVSALLDCDHRIMVRIPTEIDEKLYGFGLQLDGLKQSQKVLTLNMDHWGRGSGRTHAPVPFYISSKGYGVFFNTARYLKVYCQVGNRKDSPNNPAPVDRNPPAGETPTGQWLSTPPADAVEAHLSANGVEVIVIAGDSMLDVVCRYNLYCGGGALPPLWGLGFWHRVPADFTAEQTAGEVEAFRERGFPLDVVGLEPGWMSRSYPCTYEWQTKRFPDPAGFTGKLLEAGIRLNLWVNPYVSPEARIHKEMYDCSGSHMVWLGLVPDYHLPEARKLLIDQHEQDHLDIGVSGYKVDEVDGYDKWLWPDHATFPSGVSGEVMRQTYGLLMQNLLYKDLFKPRNQRTYGNARAANGAASGYPFVIYSDSYSHAEYITGISSASLCGVLWTPEVRSAETDRTWLNRFQTVCFSSMALLNAWASGTKPWSYPSVSDAVRETVQLRMRLLPYLYSAFADYHFRGVPPMRAMILEEGFDGNHETVVEGMLDGEKDPYAMGRTIETTDQFMFGPSILVAPFYEEQATERKVQLPTGAWYDFHTGAPVGGGTTVTVTAEALRDRVPLFVKDGAIIPMLAESVANTEAAYGADLEVRIYGTADGVFDLYEDDGKTFDYDRGNYRIRRFVVRNGQWTEELVKDDAPALFGKTVPVNFVSE